MGVLVVLARKGYVSPKNTIVKQMSFTGLIHGVLGYFKSAITIHKENTT